MCHWLYWGYNDVTKGTEMVLRYHWWYTGRNDMSLIVYRWNRGVIDCIQVE